jgi:hypothetical protein
MLLVAAGAMAMAWLAMAAFLLTLVLQRWVTGT